MNELTIGSGDEASLSVGIMMGTWRRGPLTGDFEGKVQKILETGVSRFRCLLGNLWSC